ncbi:hypothetical protein C8F01DRAFT_1021194 [Mycena amicta]|nr:hypothetical protein C8F01DRAFT_1021194 [Mycena amicta]
MTSLRIAGIPSTCLTCGVASPHEDLPRMPPISPEFAELLSTNAPPLDSEVPATRAALVQIKARLRAISARTDSLRSAMESLKTERKAVKSFQRAVKAVLLPIRHLPAEIIGDIFLVVAGSHPDRTPWYLGHICSAWRRVALGLPGLWSDIRLTYVSQPFISDALYAQLNRTGTAGLSITVAFVDPPAVDPSILSLPDALLDRSNQWVKLSVSCPNAHIRVGELLRSMTRAAGPLARLARLVLSNVDWQYGDETLAQFIKQLPALRGVSFTRSLIPTPANSWHNITHFHADDTPGWSPVVVFEYAPNLIECVSGWYQYSTAHSLQATPTRIFTLPNLRRLVLHNPFHLHNLRAPRLESLATTLTSSTLLIDFIQRSSCRPTLTDLVLADSSIADRLIDLLRVVPSLESLTLHGRNKISLRLDDFFDALTISESSTVLCSRLSSLALLRHPTNSVNTASAAAVRVAFMNMARSRTERTQYAYRLRRLDVYVGEKDLFGKKGLQELLESRMDARIVEWDERRDIVAGLQGPSWM